MAGGEMSTVTLVFALIVSYLNASQVLLVILSLGLGLFIICLLSWFDIVVGWICWLVVDQCRRWPLRL